MRDGLAFVHIVSLSLWFGGLFGYLVIVWPAMMRVARGRFPRTLLASVAMGTAPWIAAAMAVAFGSLLALGVTGGFRPAGVLGAPLGGRWLLVYGLLLTALIANNVYGMLVTWPRMMLLPEPDAVRAWLVFRIRMGVSLVVGLALHAAAVLSS